MQEVGARRAARSHYTRYYTRPFPGRAETRPFPVAWVGIAPIRPRAIDPLHSRSNGYPDRLFPRGTTLFPWAHPPNHLTLPTLGRPRPTLFPWLARPEGLMII
jgi:hypothetical protein